MKGFTLIEAVIVLAIFAVLATISIPNIVSLQKTPALGNASEEIMTTLSMAQNKALSSEGNSKYGVYFTTATTPDQYVLFKGNSYATRDTAFDKVIPLRDILEFSQINTGADNEVVFEKLNGSTANTGNVTVRFIDQSQSKTIYIDGSGVVGYTALSTPADARTTDSRHIAFDYSRTINTTSENIVLTFNGNVVQTIPISSNMNNGQIDWSGTFAINGVNQTVSIHTLRLNTADTRFSIFRDRRFNTVSLAIKLSGDTTGTIAEYSANGLTTDFHSIYVTNFAWQ